MKNQLSYPYEMYSPDVLIAEVIDIKAQQREYARLRVIANKRLKRLSQSEFKHTEIYKLYKGSFTRPATQLTERELAYKLTEIARFVSKETSSVRGQQSLRKRTLETLHDRGYTGINIHNYQLFGEFMDEYRKQREDRIYSSVEVAEVFEKSVTDGETAVRDIMKDFKAYMHKYKEID